MPRHNELEKTWLPGPSRGTQTFNAPSNLTIDYGRHVATISGRGASGTNPGDVYTINYSTNYSVAYPISGYTPNYTVNNNTNYNASPVEGNNLGGSNRPETGRPVVNNNTNYTLSYAISGYNLNYSINYAITYGISYGIAGYSQNYSISYNVVKVDNTVAVYNAVPVESRPSFVVPVYNIVTTPVPVSVFGTNYNRVDVQDPSGTLPIVGTGVYNPATSVDWNAVTFYQVERRVSKPGQPLEYAVFVNNINYSSGTNPTCPPDEGTIVSNYEPFFFSMLQEVTYDVDYTCSPKGNFENYVANFTPTYPIGGYNQNYNLTYNTAYPVNYNLGYNIAYNVTYPLNYNIVTNYNIVENRPNTGFLTNYNTAYPETGRPETGRPSAPGNANNAETYPISGYGTNNNITYSINYVVSYPIGNQPEGNRPIIGNNTNYNVVYPVVNQPEANRPLVGYSPGAPGAPMTILGVFFPGGPVGTPAPNVPETTVKYWDYPDFQSHPIPVPPGAQIIVKLE